MGRHPPVRAISFFNCPRWLPWVVPSVLVEGKGLSTTIGSQIASENSATPSVLVVDHVAQASGGQLAMFRLACRLRGAVEVRFVFLQTGPMVDRARREGFQANVISMGPAAELAIADISPVAHLASLGPSLLDAVRALAVAARTCDVVYTNSEKAHIVGGSAARLAHRPWVMHARTHLAPPYLPPGLARALRLFLTVSRPAAVIANSEYTAAALPWGRGRAHVIPSGLERRPERAPDPDPGVFTLGLLGRLEAPKGQHVAIAAMPAIVAAFPGARLMIGGDAAHGDPSYAEGLPALAARLGVADNVTMRGFIDDPYAFFRDVHVALITTLIPEALGQVVLEALAVGRPVVAAAKGGPQEILAGAGAGVCVAPGDVAALADAVIALGRDPATRSAMAQAAIARAARYGIDESAERTQAVLASVVKRRRRRTT